MSILLAGLQSDTIRDGLRQQATYDNFLGRKNKPSPAIKEQRKERRKAFWQNLSQKYQNSGGAAGIGATVDNLVNLFRPNQEEPSDYTYGLADSDASQNQGLPVSVFIIGGIVLLGTAGLAYAAYRKKT